MKVVRGHMPAGPTLGAWVRLRTGWNLLLTFIRTLQTGSCLSLEVAHIINEMIVLRAKQTTCASLRCKHRCYCPNSSHIAPRPYVESAATRSILGSTTRTKSLWWLIYFGKWWPALGSKSLCYEVTCFVNGCEIQPVIEKETDWRWGLQSSGMLRRVTEYMITDVSGKCSGPIFQVEMSKTNSSSSSSSSSFRQLDEGRTGSRLCGMKDVWTVLRFCSFI